MRVLVVGGGAREHALVRAALAHPAVERVWCAPGNAGTAREPRCENAAVRADDVAALTALARREGCALAVVGPEAPLVAGLGDALRAAGVAVFGPDRAGAQLEGSKCFAKEFLVRAGVPTARAQRFERSAHAAALRFVRENPWARVVKADGLAGGKGVVVADDAAQACAAIDALFEARVCGPAGDALVLEERLAGAELSLHVLFDGASARVLGVAQDHKRLGDGDAGPNTGGMGAYAPVPRWSDDAALRARVERAVLAPTLEGLAREGLPFRGVLFVGLMVADDGAPSVLEYNVRFGDPECAVLLAGGDEAGFFELLVATAQGRLAGAPAWRPSRASVGVVLASRGYPEAPERGAALPALAGLEAPPERALLHASTRLDPRDGVARVDGGRVLLALGAAPTLEGAAAHAYELVERAAFEGARWRRDIGARAGLAPAR